MTRSRAECEKIGLRCVEELLEKNITEDQLLKAGGILTANQYSDVVEERNIDSLCGYPLCDTPLGPIPTQKYHISLAKKQIFDLTERKKFCSGVCFKCSQYYAAQLSTTHLWLRTDTKRKKIKLLPKDSSTLMEVSVKSEGDEFSSKPMSQHYVPPHFSELQNLESLSITEKNTEPFPNMQPTLSDDDSASGEDSLDDGSELGDREGEEEEEGKEEDATASSVLTSVSLVRSSADNSSSEKKVPFPVVSQVSKLLSAISTWMSIPQGKGVGPQEECRSGDNTLKSQDSNNTREDRSCDHQGQADQELHDHKDRSSDQDNITCDSSRKAHDSSHDSNKKALDSNQPSCVKNMSSHASKKEAGDSSGALCDQSKASLDSTKDSLKTADAKSKSGRPSSKNSKHVPAEEKSTIAGKGKLSGHSVKSSKHDTAEKRVEEGEPEGVFLPPVHSINVGGIQRSLFNSQLRQHLSSVCPVLGLSLHHVLPLVNATTQKFRLNRHCITFRVAEWKILSLLLLIISCKDIESSDMLIRVPVKQWLQAIQATEQDFQLMLASFSS